MTPATRQRLAWGALAVSLVVNGFFIGAYATDYFAKDERRRGGTLRVEWNAVADRLPQEYRDRMREDFKGRLPEFREGWSRLRALRQEIRELTAQPTPDRAGVEARLAQVRQISSELQLKMQTLMFDAVLDFPPEVRAALLAEQADDDKKR